MITTTNIFSYAQSHDINLIAKDGQLKIDAPETALTDEFLESAMQYKSEILAVLTKEERWNPELAVEGYVWCVDCQHFNGVDCDHIDNPFHTVTKCPQAPRKCQWYKSQKRMKP
jgi:hypothetical protein